MKLFSFFKQRKLTLLDRASTTPLVLAIKKASVQNDYEAFKQYINNAPLDIVVEFAAKFPNSYFIQRYSKDFPNNADGHFLYGNQLIYKAWQTRSQFDNKKMPAYQFSIFSRLLNAAHAELCQVLRLNPTYHPAFSLLIKVQRGKNNKKLAETIYQQAKKIAPTLMDYHLECLKIHSPKWGGSIKAMFDFTQECAQKDPTGMLYGLIPAVHFEYWYSLDHSASQRHITSKRVRQELKQAYLEVENAEFGTGYYQQHQYYLILNYFSLLFLVMGEKEKAKTIFNRIEGKYTYRPWIYMGTTPGIAYLDYKKRA